MDFDETDQEPTETVEEEVEEQEEAEPQEQEAGDDGYDFVREAPSWLKEFDARGDVLPKLSADELERLPIEAKHALHAQYRSYEGRLGEVDQLEQQLKARLRELEDERLAAYAERMQFAQLFNDDRLKNTLTVPEPEDPSKEPDPYSREGVALAARREASAIVQAWLEQVNAVAGERTAEMEQQQQQAARQAKLLEVKQFADENPKFRQYKEDIKEYIQKYGMDYQKAYEVVLALREGKQELSPTEKKRARAQALSSRGGGGTGGKSASALQGKSASERAAILADNPDLQEQMLKEMRRGF